MPEYPIILVPSAIQNAQIAEPPVKTIEQFTGPEPRKPGEPPKKFYGKGTAIWSFIAVITGGFASGLFSLPTLPCVVFFLLLAVSRVIYLFQSYPERLKEHKNDVKKYEKDMIDYRVKRNSYPVYVEEQRTPEKIKSYREERLSEVLRNTVSYDGSNGNALTGLNEPKLYNALKKYFSNSIHKNLIVQNPKYDLGFHYTPDCVYIDRNLNLYIDIELDEPYTTVEGEIKPIHHETSSKDVKRNNHFNSRGWIVIRFSEEQVVCNVESCCKTVAQVIAGITGDNSILNAFRNIPDLTPMRQWTYEEAIEMAKKHYRNNYPCRSSNLKLVNTFDLDGKQINIYGFPGNPQHSQKTQNTVPVSNLLTTCPYCNSKIKTTRLESHKMTKCPKRPSL